MAMHNFISAEDVSDIPALIQQALVYKNQPLLNQQLGAGKRIGLLFLNPSLRTRLSTQIAARNLGMEAIVFNVDKEGWALEFEEGAIMSGSTVEHIKDAGPVLGQYFDILCIRTFPSLMNKEDDYSEMSICKICWCAGDKFRKRHFTSPAIICRFDYYNRNHAAAGMASYSET